MLQCDQVFDDDQRVARRRRSPATGAERADRDEQRDARTDRADRRLEPARDQLGDERGGERRHHREHQRGADRIDGDHRRPQDVRGVGEVVTRGRERARGRDAGEGLAGIVDENRQPGADHGRDADRGEQIPPPPFAHRQDGRRERRGQQQRHDP